jgi:hypothetical protein
VPKIKKPNTKGAKPRFRKHSFVVTNRTRPLPKLTAVELLKRSAERALKKPYPQR